MVQTISTTRTNVEGKVSPLHDGGLLRRGLLADNLEITWKFIFNEYYLCELQLTSMCIYAYVTYITVSFAFAFYLY